MFTRILLRQIICSGLLLSDKQTLLHIPGNSSAKQTNEYDRYFE